jgi:YcxB-like protein
LEYQISVRYDKSIIDSAAKQYWVKSFAWKTALGFILLGGAGGSWFYFDSRTWYTATFLALSVILIFMMTALFFVYRNRSLNKLKEMESPIGRWGFTEEVFSVESGMGKVEFKWSVVKKLWRFPDVWLLIYADQSYSTLPVADVSTEVQQFIVEQIQSHGGRVK